MLYPESGVHQIVVGAKVSDMQKKATGRVRQGGVNSVPAFRSGNGPVMPEWQRFDYVVFSGLVYLRHAVLRQVTVQQQPFFILFRQHRPQKLPDALFVGENPPRRHAVSLLCSGAPAC